MRFRQRFVQKTIATHLEGQLVALGWVNAPINFGATAVAVIETDPEDLPAALKSNTVAISMGDEAEDTVEELGGGFYSVETPVFFDIFGDSHAVAVAIASDIKEMYTRGKRLTVQDWTTGSAVPTTEYIDFETVVGPIRPQGTLGASDPFLKHWRVVKAMAVVYYQPTDA